ncbi:MAG: D-alanyl-D-alanine carboxypeptidase [Fimbriimonas sp.]|nr:D-alanyl-D-alanine carboxypeptidase [Fimbriimonas sp.]
MLFATAYQTFAPTDLDRILADPKLGGATVSAIVTDLEGAPIYRHDSDAHVVPASNQKLLSNSFALWALGPDYRPKTSFWKSEDRIVIDCPGDPLMTYAALQQAKVALGIDGRSPVFLHEAYAPEIPDSWEIDDLPNRYAAAVSALTFDRGSFEAWSRKRRFRLEPEAFGVNVKFLGGKGRPQIQYDPIRRRLEISGEMPAANERLDTLALPEPDLAAGSIFGHSVTRTTEIPVRTADYVITGGTTKDMVAACLPPSDNNIAENLLLMGARTEGELGEDPYTVSRKRLENFMTRIVGVEPGDVHVFDGSGMSRHNYVTTRAIARLLCWEQKQPTGDFWHHALAHPGNGTLSNRLKGLQFDAKTGSLDMVASLSGYLTTDSGKKVVVSIILNQFGCSSAEARAIQDEFVLAVAHGLR